MTTTRIAGTIGAGSLLVLHPAFSGDPDGAPFAYGITRFLVRRLVSCERPSKFLCMRAHMERRDSGTGAVDRETSLALLAEWPPDEVSRLIVSHHGFRWGVVPMFAAHGTCSELRLELFELATDTHDAQAHAIESWSFAGDNLLLPAAIHGQLAGIMRLTGTRCPWAAWQDSFETHDPIAALELLRVYGVSIMVEEGCRVERDTVLALVLALIERAPGMQLARAVVPEILRAFAKRGEPPLQLVAWLRRAREVVGDSAEWAHLAKELA